MFEPLTSCEWLLQNLHNTNIRIIDASYYPKDPSSDAFQEYKDEHIQGAVFLDLRECRDKSSKYSNALPSSDTFERELSSIGIRNDHHVIIYEKRKNVFYAAPRVWMMFRIMGHEKVSLLNGGFSLWKQKKYPITSSIESLPKTIYSSNFTNKLLASTEDLKENLTSKTFYHIDTRSKKQFIGEESPKGFAKGHLIGSINVPIPACFDAKTNCFLSKEEIEEYLEKFRINETTPIISSCNSGMTACGGLFLLYCIGNTDARLYPSGMQGFKDEFLDELEINE